ncbi:MAG TPA: hypothetical protein VHN81_06385 [Edaphobacter sp.]|nr:hypothetical protein [Edaphobacter sp.]
MLSYHTGRVGVPATKPQILRLRGSSRFAQDDIFCGVVWLVGDDFLMGAPTCFVRYTGACRESGVLQNTHLSFAKVGHPVSMGNGRAVAMPVRFV